MPDTIRYYIASSCHEYYDTEDEAISACNPDNGESVVREVRSGKERSRQQIYPTVGESYSDFP